MVSLTVLFYMYIILFAVIGAMRGWAKEIMVSFSVILAIFIITVLERFIPFIRDSLQGLPIFWLRSGILLALVFFGYQGPNIPRLAATGKFVRDRLQDTLLGVFIGALNGYLIFGTFWFFMNDAGYPFPIITAPDTTTEIGKIANDIISILPPQWLGTPVIYFAVALAFVFVLVVFI